jgi:hypothetical protein
MYHHQSSATVQLHSSHSPASSEHTAEAKDLALQDTYTLFHAVQLLVHVNRGPDTEADLRAGLEQVAARLVELDLARNDHEFPEFPLIARHLRSVKQSAAGHMGHMSTRILLSWVMLFKEHGKELNPDFVQWYIAAQTIIHSVRYGGTHTPTKSVDPRPEQDDDEGDEGDEGDEEAIIPDTHTIPEQARAAIEALYARYAAAMQHALPRPRPVNNHASTGHGHLFHVLTPTGGGVNLHHDDDDTQSVAGESTYGDDENFFSALDSSACDRTQVEALDRASQLTAQSQQECHRTLLEYVEAIKQDCATYVEDDWPADVPGLGPNESRIIDAIRRLMNGSYFNDVQSVDPRATLRPPREVWDNIERSVHLPQYSLDPLSLLTCPKTYALSQGLEDIWKGLTTKEFLFVVSISAHIWDLLSRVLREQTAHQRAMHWPLLDCRRRQCGALAVMCFRKGTVAELLSQIEEVARNMKIGPDSARHQSATWSGPATQAVRPRNNRCDYNQIRRGKGSQAKRHHSSGGRYVGTRPYASGNGGSNNKQWRTRDRSR